MLSISWSCSWRIPKKAITVGLIAALAVLMTVYVRRHRHRWSDWGLTLKGSGRAIIESLLCCVPPGLAAVVLKWWLVRQSGSTFYGQPVFESVAWHVAVAYFLMSYMQEIVGRGFMQSTIERFLSGRYRGAMAIIAASLLFSVAHSHYSPVLMLVSMLGGFLFGWLFRRHGTIAGAGMAHFVLGTLAWDVLRLIGW